MTLQTIIPETTAQPETVEQSLLNIVRMLPHERILQRLDFAQFLAWQASRTNQPQPAEFADDPSNRDPWNDLLAQPAAQQTLHRLAEDALIDFHAGKSTDIEKKTNDELHLRTTSSSVVMDKKGLKVASVEPLTDLTNITQLERSSRVSELAEKAEVASISTLKTETSDDKNSFADLEDVATEMIKKEWYDFIEQSYGCLADDPIERSVQG